MRRQPALESAQQVLAEVRVLVEDTDLRLRCRPRDVAAVDEALASEAREVWQRPREALSVRERARARAGEELRDAFLIQVRADGEVLLGAEAVEDREDAVLLNELPRLLHRLRGVVGVVEVLVVDLPSVDAALRVVDVLEVAVGAVGDRLERRGGTAERIRPADQDRGRGYAGRVVGLGACKADDERDEERAGEREEARHCEIGFSRTGMVTVARPTASFALGGCGMSR